MNVISTIYLVIICILGLLAAYILPLPLPRYKVWIGPALGIIIVTELTFGTSLVFGFSIFSICVSLTIFVGILAFICWRLSPSFKFKRQKVLQIFKEDWPLWIMLLFIGIPATYIWWTQVLYPSSFGLLTGTGGLYGDTALHSAYTMSLVTQGFPPQNPLFAGIPLVYPFMVNLFSAILVKLGSDLRFAFILPHYIYFIAVVTLLYSIGKRIAGNLGVLFASFMFFFGWGWGFVNYIQDSLQSNVWTITKEYTNNIPGFVMHNVFTGLIFPERSFLPGLFLGLLITLMFVKNGKRSLFESILVGLILGILPLWHTHTFIFFSLAIGIWLAKDAIVTLLRFFQSKHTLSLELIQPLTLGLTTAILAIPTLIWFSKQVSHGSFMHFVMGWMDAKTDPLFWLKNMGLVLPLGLLIFLMRRFRYKWLIFPALVIFLLANLVMFQPWDWDNIKLFSWVGLFFAFAVGFLLSEWWRKNLILKLGVAFIMISLVASGILSMINQLQHSFTIYDSEGIQLTQWIMTNTKPSDTFLIDPWPNHPVPGLTGRSVYLGYPGHLWVHGIDYGKREAQVKQILSGAPFDKASLETPVDYIVTSINQPLTKNVLVYQNKKFIVYKN